MRTPIVLTKHGFHIGDRVKFVDEVDPDDGVVFDQEGTICTFEGCDGDNIGVRWDKNSEEYHNCANFCEYNHGWYVPYHMSVFNKPYVKNKYGFSIGDIVTVVTRDPSNVVPVGSVGTVCDLDHNFVGSDVGIELNYEHPNNHNCCGRCKNRYGRYVPHECLKLAVIDFGEIDTSVNSVDELFNSIL